MDYAVVVSNSLHHAIARGDMDTLKRLLDCGVNPDEPDWNRKGWAPLLEACQLGNIDAVRILLGKGVNVNVSSAQGEGPLHIALRLGHYDIVRLLLDDKSLDPNVRDNLSGQSPLHILAKACVAPNSSMGQTEKFLFPLLEDLAEKAIVDSTNHQKETPLHRVCQGQKSCVKAAEILLEAGADPDLRNVCGLTPLLCAIEKGNVPVAVLLISRGANLNLVDRYGQTALHYAARKGMGELVSRLLERRPNVNLADSYLDTPLHLAASKNYPGIVRALILHPDTEANCRNARGKTPLHIAIETGSTRVVRALLQAGKGDIHIRTSEEEEWTTLEVALRARGRGSINSEIITIIVEALKHQRREWDKLDETVI